LFLPVPLRDSVVAVADASYLDWAEVPETPGELRAVKSVGGARLEWKTYGEPGPCEIQRSVDYGPRQALGRVEHGRQEFTDAARPAGHVSYRVRVLGKKGASPCSNPAWVEAP